MKVGILYGLTSAALFGLSTPLAKLLVGSVPALWLAALLYLGAGFGLLKASASDAVLLAALKGIVAGSVNAALAVLLALPLPPPPTVAGAAVVGFLGYGVSLVLFILALRHLGTARAGAYFSVAPFFGAAIAVLIGLDIVTWSLTGAAVLMALGVWLHITEHHSHEHRHEALEHTHPHTHDEHHEHSHAFEWDGSEPHVHRHVHAPLLHGHPHFPDVHLRHRHGFTA